MSINDYEQMDSSLVGVLTIEKSLVMIWNFDFSEPTNEIGCIFRNYRYFL